MRASEILQRLRRGATLWPLGVLAIAALLVYFRLNYQTRLLNGDDWIVLGVVQGMAARGDLNTNWAVNPVPEDFRYAQFNFSSYNLLAHAILALAPDALPAIPVLRFANLVMQAVAAALLALGMRNARLPLWAVAVGAALFVIAPGVVHDAHMLRTESLLYLLFAVVFWSATSARPLALRVLVAGAAIGFGAASKITFLGAGLVMAPAVLATMTKTPRRILSLGAAAGASAALAFALGAPYALLDPVAYLEGMEVLNAQYAGGHRPHALMKFDPLRQAAWIGGFFLLTCGPLALAGLFAPLLARPPAWVVGLWLSSAATILWFAQQRTFFERNYGLAVVAAAVMLAWLAARRPRLGLALAVLSAVPMLWWSQQILEETLDHKARRTAWEQAHGLRVSHYVVGFRPPAPDLTRCDGVFGVLDFGDDWTRQVLAEMDARGGRRIARYEGRFHGLPTSTLHNFLDQDVAYYACRPW